MTARHHHECVLRHRIGLIAAASWRVTCSEGVTPIEAVTQEILASQGMSPLSSVSLVFFYYLHTRDRGLGVSFVTGDGGDIHKRRVCLDEINAAFVGVA